MEVDGSKRAQKRGLVKIGHGGTLDPLARGIVGKHSRFWLLVVGGFVEFCREERGKRANPSCLSTPLFFAVVGMGTGCKKLHNMSGSAKVKS